MAVDFERGGIPLAKALPSDDGGILARTTPEEEIFRTLAFSAAIDNIQEVFLMPGLEYRDRSCVLYQQHNFPDPQLFCIFSLLEVRVHSSNTIRDQ